MKEIDFLPQRYHDQNARRHAVAWRLLVIAVFGGAVMAAAVAQFAYRLRVQASLEQVRPQLAAAQVRTQLLLDRQTELNEASAAAALCALLESPWPRTQILTAIFDPLPPSITIDELHLAQRDKPAPAGSSGEMAPAVSSSGNEAVPAAPAAKRDLIALQAENGRRQTVVHLTGAASDVRELNAYLELLQRSRLIARVELLSLEHDAASGAAAASPARLKFEAQATIRPSLAQVSASMPLSVASALEQQR